MSEFINTIDVLGDDVVIDSIIQRTITVFRDDSVKKVGNGAFYGCGALNIVDLPSVTTIDSDAFNECIALNALILRSDSVATLSNTNALTGTQIALGTGYIYVPNSLVDSYKSATNWSTFSEQIRGIDSSTMLYYVESNLYGVSSSNTVDIVGQSYYTTLTAVNGASIGEVIVTMGGIDITADAYNAETGEISIQLVTGDLVITASMAVVDYTLVSYIGATGTQYIDLGVPLTASMAVEVDTSFDSNADGQYMGTIVGSSAYKRAHFGVNHNAININAVDVSTFNSDRHTYYVSASSTAFDGNSISNNIQFPVGTNFYLFYRNGNGGSYSQTYCAAKVYGAKIYEGDVPTHEFIPAVRNADGVAGMYDRNTGNFLVNAGTGEFTVG